MRKVTEIVPTTFVGTLYLRFSQAYHLPALFETVTGHEQMEGASMKAAPSAHSLHSSLKLGFFHTPDLPSVEVGRVTVLVWLA